MLPNVIAILPQNSLFIAVNFSCLYTDNSYIRECNLRNHLFQQIQVPDLDITPQHYYENPRKREFCPLFIGSVLFKLGEYQTIVSRRKYIIFFKEQQMALSDYKAISWVGLGLLCDQIHLTAFSKPPRN